MINFLKNLIFKMLVIIAMKKYIIVRILIRIRIYQLIKLIIVKEKFHKLHPLKFKKILKIIFKKNWTQFK